MSNIIENIHSGIKAEPFQGLDSRKETIIASLPFGKRLALKLLLPLAHSCVANREASKSLLIRFLILLLLLLVLPVISPSCQSHRTVEGGLL